MAEKPQPGRVLYCPVCTLPAEYCEYGPDFEKCKPWLIENAPELYPDLLKEANGKEADKVSEQLQSVGISSSGSDAAAPASSSGGTSTSKQEEVKRLPGGKIKKKEKQEVVIEKVVRNKRKCITIVKGLDLFGIKLSDASKKLGKKFATGASVVKGQPKRSKLMSKETYPMISWSSLRRPGLTCQKLQFTSLRMAEKWLLLDLVS